MGLLWYLAAIFAWWLISGILGGGLGRYSQPGELVFMIAITAFFYAGFWLPYISYIAISEKLFFMRFPERKVLFFLFVILSFAAYSAVVLYHPKWSGLWPLLVWPAAVVTIMYVVRRSIRKTAPDGGAAP